MSDTETAPEQAPEPVEAPVNEQAQDAPQATTEPPAQENTDWKAEARKWEARAKDNRKANEELTGTKTSLEHRLADLEKEREDLVSKVQAFESEKELAKAAREVSKETGIPADALRGSSKAELEAHAEQLKSLLSTPYPVISGVGKTPAKNAGDPNREAVRNLFGTKP